MNLIVRDSRISTNESFIVYDGEVQNLPYWVAEKTFTADEFIEIDGDSIVIDISKPARHKDAETNKKWLDTLSEEEVLLYLAGFLYHYDVGTIHDEAFNDTEWSVVFRPMIDYVKKRLGGISFSKKNKRLVWNQKIIIFGGKDNECRS